MAACWECGATDVPPLGAPVLVKCEGCERLAAAVEIPNLMRRTNNNVRLLAHHVERWGFVLGSMPQDEAYEYLQEAENLVAEVNAKGWVLMQGGDPRVPTPSPNEARQRVRRKVEASRDEGGES